MTLPAQGGAGRPYNVVQAAHILADYYVRVEQGEAPPGRFNAYASPMAAVKAMLEGAPPDWSMLAIHHEDRAAEIFAMHLWPQYRRERGE